MKRILAEAVSDFRDAVKAHLEHELICPKCGAANRPNVFYMRIEQDGSVVCDICAHSGAIEMFGKEST